MQSIVKGATRVRVFDTLSPNVRQILDVTRPSGAPLGKVKQVRIALIKPTSQSARFYTLIVGLDDSDGLIVLKHKFEARQTAPIAAVVTNKDRGGCADMMRARGDIVVILCKEDKTLRFYRANDLSLVTMQDIRYGGHWTELGDKGFDIVQNGNSYIVFFTAY